MGLRISTNVASLNAQKNLGMTQHATERSMARLSSGFRINQAADDAAGLAIADGFNRKALLFMIERADSSLAANDSLDATNQWSGHSKVLKP